MRWVGWDSVCHHRMHTKAPAPLNKQAWGYFTLCQSRNTTELRKSWICATGSFFRKEHFGVPADSAARFCTKKRVRLGLSCSPFHTNCIATTGGEHVFLMKVCGWSFCRGLLAGWTDLRPQVRCWYVNRLQIMSLFKHTTMWQRGARTWKRCCRRSAVRGAGQGPPAGACTPANGVSDEELVAVRRASGAEIRMMPGQRLQGCRSLHLNEDNGRFALLAILILVYLLCGAAVFSAIERPSELRAHGRWNGTLHNFSETFNISLQELNSFLRQYEAAIAAGVRADALRARWDFTGAFYFVGTVVSTIGGWSPWPLPLVILFCF